MKGIHILLFIFIVMLQICSPYDRASNSGITIVSKPYPKLIFQRMFETIIN